MSAFSSQNPLYGLSQRPSNQGWLFHPKMPYTGNQDDFSAATGVHPNRFQHAFIQTQSMGASPHTPKTIFHRPLVAYAAGVPERGFFRCRRKRMARLGETCVNAHHIFFLTNGCRLGVGKLWHFTFFFGLVEHLRRRQNFYDIMAKKRFRHAAALVCKTENVRRKETGKCPS